MAYYTLELLERLYRRQFPELTETEVKAKADKLYSQITALDEYWKRLKRRRSRMMTECDYNPNSRG